MLICGATLKISGTKLVKSKTQDKQANQRGKVLQVLSHQNTIKVMLCSRQVSTIRSLM